MATTGPMTAEELMHVPDEDCQHELVRGELVSLPFNSGIHGFVVGNLCGLLGQYALDHPEFRALAGGVGIIIERDPDTVRGADFILVHQDRVPRSNQGYLPAAPNFVAEVLSIWDEASYENAKILDYLTAGVDLLWYIDPHLRIVHVYTPDLRAQIHREGDKLEGGAVLPELSLRVGEIFA
jgi:Uma2 family endonuclease